MKNYISHVILIIDLKIKSNSTWKQSQADEVWSFYNYLCTSEERRNHVDITICDSLFKIRDILSMASDRKRETSECWSHRWQQEARGPSLFIPNEDVLRRMRLLTKSSGGSSQYAAVKLSLDT
jgi:hypothetical protein